MPTDNLSPLTRFAKIVESDGTPTVYFTRWAQQLYDMLGAGAGVTEVIEDAVGAMFVDSTEIDFTYDDSAGSLTAALIADSVVVGKLHLTATQRLVGRATAGSGGGEELQIGTVLDWLGNTTGDLLVRGTGGWEVLAAATSGTVLTSNGAGAVPSWEAGDIQSLLDGISTTRGSVLYRGASAWVALTPGTAGQALTTQGAGADPAWGDVATTSRFPVVTGETPPVLVYLPDGNLVYVNVEN